MAELFLCPICANALPRAGAPCPACSTAQQEKITATPSGRALVIGSPQNGITGTEATAIATAPVRSDRMIGVTVGNYRILSLLGSGGMGTVYRAIHPGLDRLAAVKVLKPELSTDTEVIGRFFNEAKAANQIGHPGIVDVFDLGEMSNGHCYMVMELLEGESLDQYRSRRGPISEGEARMIGLRVLDILGAAHAKGIIHRDLKPANIFLSRKAGKSTLKLLDFGIAKLMGNNAPIGATQSGTFLGTPRYMAPEQARSASGIDARADLYSLGVVLYELLTGKPIFPMESAVAMIHAHQFEEPALIRTIRPEISTALERVLARALVKDPNDRYSSAEEFSQALRVAYQPGSVDDQGDGPSTIVDDRPFGADVRSTVEMDLEFPLDAGGIELEAAPSIREAATQIQAAPVSSRLAAVAPAPGTVPAPEKAKKKKSAFADPERDTQEDPPGSQGDIGTIEIGAAPPIRKASGSGWVWAVLLAVLGAGALLLVLTSGALQHWLE